MNTRLSLPIIPRPMGHRPWAGLFLSLLLLVAGPATASHSVVTGGVSSFRDLGLLSEDNPQITKTSWAVNDIPWIDDGPLNDDRFLHRYSFGVDESVLGRTLEIEAKNVSSVHGWLGGGLFHIEALVVELFSQTHELLFRSGALENEIPLVEAGLYYLNVSGNADGLLGGLYKLSLEAEEPSPVDGNVVPLPPAVVLFGSALLGLLGIARRKQA